MQGIEQTLALSKSWYGEEYDLAELSQGFNVSSPGQTISFVEEVRPLVRPIGEALGLLAPPSADSSRAQATLGDAQDANNENPEGEKD